MELFRKKIHKYYCGKNNPAFNIKSSKTFGKNRLVVSVKVSGEMRRSMDLSLFVAYDVESRKNLIQFYNRHTEEFRKPGNLSLNSCIYGVSFN